MWWPFSRKYPERRPEDVDCREYDYVVVGGGTAGCVLASRLSEDPNISVLVIERGPANDSWFSRIPIVSSNILRSDDGATNWNCEPMKHCGDRKTLFFCAEVLGGGSRINSMVYTRGSPADYDSWAALGHPDWSYEKVLPYFIKSEKSLDWPDQKHRGQTGPWYTKAFRNSTWIFSAFQKFVDAAVALGFPVISDANTPEAPPDGICQLDSTVNANNQRVSTMDAFLSRDIVLKREKNLSICTNAILSQIIFSDSKSRQPRADKVLFKYTDSRKDKIFTAKVKREVIVCSGAIGSPQVLMLSGIGPKEHLGELGITVVKDLPGVGSELTDHLAVPVGWEVPIKESLTAVASSPATKGAIEFFKYLLFRTGLLSMPVLVLTLFLRSSSLNKEGTQLESRISKDSTKLPLQDLPDLELMPLATSACDDVEEHYRVFNKLGVFSSLATLLQPKSRGTVRLASSNPYDRPKIDFGILSNPEDYVIARQAIRLSIKMGDLMKAAGFPILRNLTYPEEKQELDIKNNNNEEIDRLIRLRMRTTYHYASTCRMAPEDDPKAPGVVDDELRVHGIANLRVCDTSVFPKIPSAHLQAPAVMVAERCADFIKKRP